MPDVSVIIPVYKVEAWLSACLDSVLAQTLENIEVICIDDASPDACPQILDVYAVKDSRIKVLHLRENMGQGNGRNLGLAHASGKYVYFLDSDDMIEPDAMEQLFNKAEEEDLDGIFFDSRAVFEDEKLAKRYASYPSERYGTYPAEPVKGAALFAEFIRQREWTCYIQRQFWKREFLIEEEIDFPVRVEHEDEVFAFKAILAAERVIYWRKPFFIRRYREESVMTSPPMPKNFYGYFMDYCYMDRFAHERGYSGPVPEDAGSSGISQNDIQNAIDRNLARIYEKLVRYYRDLSGKYDLEALFQTQEEKNLYYFFASSQKAWMHYGMLSREVLRMAEEAEHLYIYGAGVLAGQVFQALAMKGIVIDGFLVTKKEGNPQALQGRPVFSWQEFSDSDTFIKQDRCFVIIAVTKGFQKDIEALLTKKDLQFCYYTD